MFRTSRRSATRVALGHPIFPSRERSRPVTHLHGESPSSISFSTMSTFEARIFEPSQDPASELKKLFASLETNRYLAHMRIAGILATMGQRRHLERVRRHFALALTEAELELHLAVEGQ